MDDSMKSNLLSSKHWLRFVFMLLFAGILQIATVLMWALVILQFIFSLLTGKDNEQLRDFGASLSRYIFDSLRFLTYNSEEKPFPFADWPENEASESSTDCESESSVYTAMPDETEKDKSSKQSPTSEQPDQVNADEKDKPDT